MDDPIALEHLRRIVRSCDRAEECQRVVRFRIEQLGTDQSENRASLARVDALLAEQSVRLDRIERHILRLEKHQSAVDLTQPRSWWDRISASLNLRSGTRVSG